jgi:hypothetical protein
MELVVEELRTDAVSAEGFFSEAGDWWEDIVVIGVGVVGSGRVGGVGGVEFDWMV